MVGHQDIDSIYREWAWLLPGIHAQMDGHVRQCQWHAPLEAYLASSSPGVCPPVSALSCATVHAGYHVLDSSHKLAAGRPHSAGGA